MIANPVLGELTLDQAKDMLACGINVMADVACPAGFLSIT